MSGNVVVALDVPPGTGDDPRPLYVTSVNLACCAIEAGTGLQRWSERHPQDDQATDPLNVLVVAGTVTWTNSHLVVEALNTLAEPRAVVAFGVCTISGGPYWDSYSVLPGISELVDVSVNVPGCPPHPQDLERVLDRLAAGELL